MPKQSLRLPFSGRRLREWRERAGLTQEALAYRCGLSRFQISRWETGNAKPEAPTLTRLVTGLSTALARSGDVANWIVLDDLLDESEERS